MRKLRVKTVAIVLTSIEGFVLLLLCVAIPIGQLKRKGSSSSCYTMWGYKNDCSAVPYTSKGKSAFGCAERRDTMTAAGVFAIFELLCVVGAFIWVVLILTGIVRGYFVPVILMLCGAGLGIVPWVLVTVVYHQKMCDCSGCSMSGKMKDSCNFDAGFILLLITWVCHVGATIFLCLMFFG